MSSLLQISPKAQETLIKLRDLVENDCIKAEQNLPPANWTDIPPIIETLKTKAKKLGLWNLFMTTEYHESQGYTNLEYSLFCRIIGKSRIAPEVTNTMAPDSGNMQLLSRFATPQQKKTYLEPLLNGTCRSAFAMTEPAMASSDPTNLAFEIRQDGQDLVLNGTKWYISGAGHPQLKFYLVFGLSGNDGALHSRHSIVIVPADAGGVKLVRPMQVFGYDDAPHGHFQVEFNNVCVPKSNLILGIGKGFEIMQARLGLGRVHHCMRAVGAAERALELHLERLNDTTKPSFGKPLSGHPVALDKIASSRIEINTALWLVLDAANEIDRVGPKKSMQKIAICKAQVPILVLRVIDRCIQAYGARGVSQDLPIAFMMAAMRTLRIADGPDEVHRLQIAKIEMNLFNNARSKSKL